MNKSEYLAKKSAPSKGPIAGACCGRCGSVNNAGATFKFDENSERRIKNKYNNLCDDCRHELVDLYRESFIE